MPYKPSDASKGFVDASQHALGVNLADVGAWLGPAIAAVWVWSSVLLGHTSGQDIPTPILWLHEILGWAGVQETWTTSVSEWLTVRPVVFWVAVLVAVYLVGVQNSSRAPMSTAVWILLIAAASTRSLASTVVWFLLLTALFTAAAAVSERLQKGSGAFIGAAWYAKEWIAGPFLMVGIVLFAPLYVLVAAVNHYRFQTARLRGVDLGIDIGRLTNGPMQDAPTRDVVSLLARVLLVDEDDRRSAADMIEFSVKQAGAKPVGTPVVTHTFPGLSLPARRIRSTDDSIAVKSRLLGVPEDTMALWQLGKVHPTDAQKRELRDLEQVMDHAAEVWAPGVIVDWLEGTNAFLDGARPIDVLRAGRLSEVLAALDSVDSGGA
ncbi:hypothetical protein GCM10009551_064720 [Nocardiopsis tropica]|uniref:hypothetical protein n=1 Tax=Tsukamurella strandjordii TaxID=147577 RepID=UPI0031DC45E1